MSEEIQRTCVRIYNRSGVMARRTKKSFCLRCLIRCTFRRSTLILESRPERMSPATSHRLLRVVLFRCRRRSGLQQREPKAAPRTAAGVCTVLSSGRCCNLLPSLAYHPVPSQRSVAKHPVPPMPDRPPPPPPPPDVVNIPGAQVRAAQQVTAFFRV
jgi:hypothetical protein